MGLSVVISPAPQEPVLRGKPQRGCRSRQQLGYSKSEVWTFLAQVCTLTQCTQMLH